MLPPTPLSITLAAGPAMSQSRETSTRSSRTGPVELAERPTSGSGSSTERPARSVGTASSSSRSVGSPFSTSVAAMTITSAAAPPVTQGDMPSSRKPSAVCFGGEHGPAEVAAAGGEMRNADGRKQLAAGEAGAGAVEVLRCGAGDASAGAGALREDERRGEAGGGEGHVAADGLLVGPALAAPLRVEEPFVDAGFAAELQLLGRPAAGAVDVGGAVGELARRARRERASRGS